VVERLPSVRAKDVVAALQRAGFVVERQKGSHVILREPASKRMTVVPMHPGEFPRPLLQTILKQAGLSVEEFRKLL
jgi:predicted RNA binding protein YcfA (HicA-like mRNA interferase family)